MVFDRSLLKADSLAGILALDYLDSENMEHLRSMTHSDDIFRKIPSKSKGMVIDRTFERLALLRDGWLQLAESRNPNGNHVYFKKIDDQAVILYMYPLGDIYEKDNLKACQVCITADEIDSVNTRDIFDTFSPDSRPIIEHALESSWVHDERAKSLFSISSKKYEFEIPYSMFDSGLSDIIHKHFRNSLFHISRPYLRVVEDDVYYNMSTCMPRSDEMTLDFTVLATYDKLSYRDKLMESLTEALQSRTQVIIDRDSARVKKVQDELDTKKARDTNPNIFTAIWNHFFNKS